MPDPSHLAPTLRDLLPLLLSFTAGSLTQLTRLLSRPGAPRLRPTLALSAAAGIAALTVGALTSAALPRPEPSLLLALACVTGWSGPGILARLSGVVERQLGLRDPATPDTRPDRRTPD